MEYLRGDEHGVIKSDEHGALEKGRARSTWEKVSTEYVGKGGNDVIEWGCERGA